MNNRIWMKNNKKKIFAGLALLAAVSALFVILMLKAVPVKSEVPEIEFNKIKADTEETESFVEEPANGDEEAEAAVKKDYEPEKYMEYEIQSSYFLKEKEMGYELVIAQADETGDYVRDVKIFVSDLNADTYCLVQVLEDKLHDGDAWDSNGLYLADVNFDGKKDIIVQNGHYGNAGVQCYACYLYKDEGYELCESFSEIPNASVDPENHYILGSWRNSAASHGYGVYVYENDRYQLWRMLTEEFLSEEDNGTEESYEMQWTDEEYSSNTESLISISQGNILDQFAADYNSDIVQEKIYGEESFWKLGDYNRWNSFQPRNEADE